MESFVLPDPLRFLKINIQRNKIPAGWIICFYSWQRGNKNRSPSCFCEQLRPDPELFCQRRTGRAPDTQRPRSMELRKNWWKTTKPPAERRGLSITGSSLAFWPAEHKERVDTAPTSQKPHPGWKPKPKGTAAPIETTNRGTDNSFTPTHTRIRSTCLQAEPLPGSVSEQLKTNRKKNKQKLHFVQTSDKKN